MGDLTPVRLRVQHEDGRIEVLSLNPAVPWQVVPGQLLNRLTCGPMDYFFTPDGHYDGWGGRLEGQDPEAIVAAIEGAREFVDG